MIIIFNLIINVEILLVFFLNIHFYLFYNNLKCFYIEMDAMTVFA